MPTVYSEATPSYCGLTIPILFYYYYFYLTIQSFAVFCERFLLNTPPRAPVGRISKCADGRLLYKSSSSYPPCPPFMCDTKLRKRGNVGAVTVGVVRLG